MKTSSKYRALVIALVCLCFATTVCAPLAVASKNLNASAALELSNFALLGAFVLLVTVAGKGITRGSKDLTKTVVVVVAITAATAYTWFSGNKIFFSVKCREVLANQEVAKKRLEELAQMVVKNGDSVSFEYHDAANFGLDWLGTPHDFSGCYGFITSLNRSEACFYVVFGVKSLRWGLFRGDIRQIGSRYGVLQHVRQLDSNKWFFVAFD